MVPSISLVFKGLNNELHFRITLAKKEEQALLISERKIFRRIYGAKYENGG